MFNPFFIIKNRNDTKSLIKYVIYSWVFLAITLAISGFNMQRSVSFLLDVPKQELEMCVTNKELLVKNTKNTILSVKILGEDKGLCKMRYIIDKEKPWMGVYDFYMLPSGKTCKVVGGPVFSRVSKVPKLLCPLVPIITYPDTLNSSNQGGSLFSKLRLLIFNPSL